METDYGELKEALEPNGFALGGNWAYEGGSFDRSLDGERRTLWLRIPFEVVHGRLDPDAPQPGTRVRVGVPYVLKHLYREGDDPGARYATFGAVINQFQTPEDPDASVSEAEVNEARRLLRQVETLFA